MADAAKAKGNSAFQAGQYEEAIKHFTEAIGIDGTAHALYSNRSAAYAALRKYSEALDDGNKTVEIKPDWPKGYSRVGAAYHGLQDYDAAVEAYKKGLELDPSSEQLKSALQDAEAAKSSGGGGGMGGLGKMFSSPDLWGKLAQNPETRAFLQQPDFVAMMQTIQKNPGSINNYIQDPRMMQVMGMLLGVNVMSGQEAAAKAEKGELGGQGTPPGASSPPPPKAEPEPVPMEEELSEEEKAAKEAKAAAQDEKAKGNEAYKGKRFDEAITFYNKAIELDGSDVSFLTNRAAVYLEVGKYDECIEDCTKAVEKGREAYADYKIIARALTRHGTALVKKDDLEGGIEKFQRSLTEHRNPDTLKKLNDAERALKARNEAAYLDPAKATEEKDLGNTAFKEGRFPEAVRHYEESLKRGGKGWEEAYKVFSNRAACYTKLAAFNEAKKDAETCIELRPDFGKGYSRKATVQFFMKEYDKAMATYQLGLGKDPENEELKDGVRRCVDQLNRVARGDVTEDETKERQGKAMQDPEIQGILSDPIMRQVLQDFQDDPKAAQHHTKNPEVMGKLQKLINAGIIQVK